MRLQQGKLFQELKMGKSNNDSYNDCHWIVHNDRWNQILASRLKFP